MATGAAVKGFLLDTNIPSELTYPRPEPLVKRWLDEAVDECLFFSVISLAEICKGIAKLPESKKRAQLQDWLDGSCALGLPAASCPSPNRLRNAWADGPGKGKPAADQSVVLPVLAWYALM